MHLFFHAYSFAIGLVIGSYLNVVVHRLPRGLSTVAPRSSCPACGQLIRWFDNLPVLSWILLRARCRNCGKPISWRYPAVELLTGLGFLAASGRWGPSLSWLVAATFVALLITLALIDAEHFLLPDRLTKPGMVVGLAGSFVVDWTQPLQAFGAALGGALLLYALIGAWWLLRKQQGMGLGDPKMLAMIGAFLGPGKMLLALFAACLVGSIGGLALLSAQRADLQTRLPFGVFLAVGGAIALFVGDPVLAWYAGYL